MLGLSNMARLAKNAWKDYCEDEAQLNRRSWVSRWPCCTTSGAAELLDVARNHQFAIATRQGSWQVIETTQLTRAGSQPWRR